MGTFCKTITVNFTKKSRDTRDTMKLKSTTARLFIVHWREKKRPPAQKGCRDRLRRRRSNLVSIWTHLESYRRSLRRSAHLLCLWLGGTVRMENNFKSQLHFLILYYGCYSLISFSFCPKSNSRQQFHNTKSFFGSIKYMSFTSCVSSHPSQSLF